MREREIPILFETKYECCGCTACYSVCPKEAVEMLADEEGFLYPRIDEKKCVNCKKCVSVCSFKQNQEMRRDKRKQNETNIQFPISYAVKNKDLDSRLQSRSGGVFVVLSNYILSEGGVVYGCVVDDKLNVVHIKAEDMITRNRMQGSKYVQSELRNCFKSVHEDLKNGRKVLFTGTSCQIAGLLAYIPEAYKDLLLTIDIVCHGVPSPKVFADYIQWMGKKYNSKVRQVDFRNKKEFGWDSHVETLRFESGKKKNSKLYTRLFYSHYTMRPSCYMCPYKSVIHPADITIADYWGIDKAASNFDDNKGVSLVLINNQKGNDYFQQCKENILFQKTKMEDSMQPPLIAPFNEPKNRTLFWKDYQNMTFDKIAKQYAHEGGIQNSIYNCLSLTKDYIKKYCFKIFKKGEKK